MMEETEPEAHLQGTIQEQMVYNRRTLREITEIEYEYESRFKLKLEICDVTATTTCTMFEEEAKKLIFQFRLNDYNFKYGYQDYTESSPKRKRTISITNNGDSGKDGTKNYSKTNIRLIGVDKGSKRKEIQNDNHEQANNFSLSKTVKQES
ncbi:hypothetical protein ZWY2020_015618 [Hordeum vulgare]|nr:hypothetical protein ZWY2020_015618 [Hordeum vulgare]